LISTSNVDVSHVDVKAKPVCLASHQQGCQRPRPPKIYTELNYIDPAGSECPDGLCTNGVGGALFSKALINGTYASPATVWTQSQSGYLHEVRVIVYGFQSFAAPHNPKTSWEDFAGWDYRIELWRDYSDFAASPMHGTYFVTPVLEPVNENRGEQIGYSVSGMPTFEWKFDLSEFDIELQAGQEYVMMLSGTGSTQIDGYIVRQLSSLEMGPDAYSTEAYGPDYMNGPTYTFAEPRLGTQIKVRKP